MNRVCQAPAIVLWIALGQCASLVEAQGVDNLQKVTANPIRIRVEAWKPRPFAEVTLNQPNLAACFARSPGLWKSLLPPSSLPDQKELADLLNTHLNGIWRTGEPDQIDITVAAVDATDVTAYVHGDTAILLVPKLGFATGEMANVLALQLTSTQLTPAVSDQRCTEPLLAFGESLARAGTLALAGLTPKLRPVSDWMDEEEAADVLSQYADYALNGKTPWPNRRALITRAGQPRGAADKLRNAAALLVEIYGDPRKACEKPFDFLLTWVRRVDDKYPKAPFSLKRALDKPLEAGLPPEKDKNARQRLEEMLPERAIGAGSATIKDIHVNASAEQRWQVAAIARAKGEPALCDWLLGGPLPASMRTGCRMEGEDGGIVFARPRENKGSDVVWRGKGGEEAVLLRWPEWLLYPIVVSQTGDLWFVDARGIWRVPLDAQKPPSLIRAGSYRHLAINPDGKTLVAASWPGGDVILIRENGTFKELPAKGNGGVTWVDAEVLFVADGEKAMLLSTSGEKRLLDWALPCSTSVVKRADSVLAGVNPPCETGILSLNLGDGSAKQILRADDGPIGLLLEADGALVFGGIGGLFRWRDKEPERITSGFTPGPG